MPSLQLTPEDEELLGDDSLPATRLAARMIVRVAEMTGAERLIPIAGAHVDGCLYHGQVSTDFAQRLVDGGGAVRVPTTLNVGAVDLLHPTLFRGDPAVATAGRELMRLYTALGCRRRNPGHRRHRARVGRSAESVRRGGRIVGVGGDVSRSGSDPGGSLARSRVRRPGAPPRHRRRHAAARRCDARAHVRGR